MMNCVNGFAPVEKPVLPPFSDGGIVAPPKDELPPFSDGGIAPQFKLPDTSTVCWMA